jgi:hypothetical protein
MACVGYDSQAACMMFGVNAQWASAANAVNSPIVGNASTYFAYPDHWFLRQGTVCGPLRCTKVQ